MLLKGMAAIAQSSIPVFDLSDLTLIAGTADTKHMSVVVFRACKKGVMKKVANGVYISTLTPPNPLTAVYAIANKLRSQSVNYVSLESQLSYCGFISQIPMDRVTMVTTGRKGTFVTPYGVIEFTHTKRKSETISDDLYLDKECLVWRANPNRAYKDLVSVGRNLDMVENLDELT